MSWGTGDRVGWVGNNWGTVAAGPIDGDDGRRYWWVVMSNSGIPATVDEQWLREDGRDMVKDGAIGYAENHGPDDPPRPVK